MGIVYGLGVPQYSLFWLKQVPKYPVAPALGMRGPTWNKRTQQSGADPINMIHTPSGNLLHSYRKYQHFQQVHRPTQWQISVAVLGYLQAMQR